MINGFKLSMKQILMLVLIVCLLMPQAAFAVETGGTTTVPN